MTIVRDLTLANWLDAPFNRRGFLRVRELVPTAVIRRDDREPTPLPADPHDLDGVRFGDVDGASTTVAEHLERSVDRGRELVVARLATEPEAVHPTRLASTGRAIAAIDAALS